MTSLMKVDIFCLLKSTYRLKKYQSSTKFCSVNSLQDNDNLQLRLNESQKGLQRLNEATDESIPCESESHSWFTTLNQNRQNTISVAVNRISIAKKKTVITTMLIIAAFLCCWTPYIMLIMWNLIHPISASSINSQLQDILFVFAVSNSCINPIVYGNHKKIVNKLCSRV
ncbi:gonadotropin-releasing hormone receptor-like protein [Dinothrombium tinctorium]|uniref:Gonadotropin-releasing hormone receptor-like protein n=3 Tax=Dinothrombium tinctorium TaxID=1965070 RepID=A0A443QDS6_9ACAR|nr:gonadotropin-releasing hormone receptor-like protein [Dinothrombium tinctorium]